MKTIGVAQLITKRGAEPETSKGVKIFKVDPKTGRPLYYEPTMLVFESQLKLLRAGAKEVPVFLGEAATRRNVSESEE